MPPFVHDILLLTKFTECFLCGLGLLKMEIGTTLCPVDAGKTLSLACAFQCSQDYLFSVFLNLRARAGP